MKSTELEQLWKHLMQLDKTVGVDAAALDDVYDSIQWYCNENGIDFETLDIDYD